MGSLGSFAAGCITVSLVLTALSPIRALAQTSSAAQSPHQSSPTFERRTTQDYNQRLQQLLQQADTSNDRSAAQDYRIGPEDLLDISVYGAPDLSGKVRVAAAGSISLPLLGSVQASGLTSDELEVVLEELLHQTYMKDPHVSVFVKEMESHPVSVFGAVEKPGVFQIRGPKNLIEVLSMAQGLANDAGNTVIVMRHGGPATPAAADYPDPKSAEASSLPGKFAKQGSLQAISVTTSAGNSAGNSIQVNLKDLLDTGDSRYNVLVYPGDVVTVTRAGVVYVVGEVTKPGGYVLKTNQNISVLQALALAEGLTHTSSGKHARIIRTEEATGARTEIPINLNKILAGHAPDPLLHAKDIVFVPNSTMKAAFYRSTEGIVSAVSGAAIYRW